MITYHRLKVACQKYCHRFSILLEFEFRHFGESTREVQLWGVTKPFEGRKKQAETLEINDKKKIVDNMIKINELFLSCFGRERGRKEVFPFSYEHNR